MPKRSVLALGLLVLAVAACKGSPSSTPTTSPTATPTPNTTVTTATVNAQYEGAAFSGTVYANAAPSGCPASTQVTGSTLSAATTPVTVNGEPYGQATFTSLTADTDYTFFFIANGNTYSSACGTSWTYGAVTIKYP